MDFFEPISFDANLSLSSFADEKALDMPLLSADMVVPEGDLIDCTTSGADDLPYPTPIADDVVNVEIGRAHV